MGAMLGVSTAGVPANDKSFQVEWICYSAKHISDDSGARMWVGDWDEGMYSLAAEIMAWFVEHKGIELTVHAPPPGGSWKHGSDSGLRMSADAWEKFGGLTAHGGVPGQQHWDTGVMDLARVCDEAAAMVGRIETVLTHVGAAGGMFPFRIGDESEDVRFVKEIARAAGHLTAPVDARIRSDFQPLEQRPVSMQALPATPG